MTSIVCAEGYDIRHTEKGKALVIRAMQMGSVYARGKCYAEGWGGLQKNFKHAVHWWRISADRGDASSQKALGVCYDKGEGVKQDLTQAVFW